MARYREFLSWSPGQPLLEVEEAIKRAYSTQGQDQMLIQHLEWYELPLVKWMRDVHPNLPFPVRLIDEEEWLNSSPGRCDKCGCTEPYASAIALWFSCGCMQVIRRETGGEAHDPQCPGEEEMEVCQWRLAPEAEKMLHHLAAMKKNRADQVELAWAQLDPTSLFSGRAKVRY